MPEICAGLSMEPSAMAKSIIYGMIKLMNVGIVKYLRLFLS